MTIERYVHHGLEVSVLSHVRGKHRDSCLCFANCANFKPGQADNCEIAEENFAMCKKHGLVTPVFECPKYVEAVS
jgi:hypothetical protein